MPFQDIILQGKDLVSIETCEPVKQILAHSIQAEYVLPSASKPGRIIQEVIQGQSESCQTNKQTNKPLASYFILHNFRWTKELNIKT